MNNTKTKTRLGAGYKLLVIVSIAMLLFAGIIYIIHSATIRRQSSASDGTVFATEEANLSVSNWTNYMSENSSGVVNILTAKNVQNTTGATLIGTNVYAKKVDDTITIFTTLNSNIKPDSCEEMFMNRSNLVSINLEFFDTSSVTSMLSMFECCESLENVNISSFNTSQVTTMFNMFDECFNLSKLDLTSFSLESIENSEGMFTDDNLLSKIYVPLGLLNAFKALDSSSMSDKMVGVNTTFNMNSVIQASSTTLKPASTGWTACEEDGGECFERGTEIKEITITNNHLVFEDKYIINEPFDVSVNGNGTLWVFVVDTDDPSGQKDMIIYGKAQKIYAPSDSSYLFSIWLGDQDNRWTIFAPYGADGCLSNVYFECFDLSLIQNTVGMFESQLLLTKLDLTTMDISNILQSTNMLSYCESLGTIYAPSNQFTTFIASSIFSNVNAEFLPASNGYIYNISNSTASVEGLLNRCYVSNLTLPSEVNYNGSIYPVTSIGNYSFMKQLNNGVKKVIIPDSIVSIGVGAFANCSITEFVILGDESTEIGDNAFFKNRSDVMISGKYRWTRLSDWDDCKIYVNTEELRQYFVSEYDSYSELFMVNPNPNGDINTGVITDIVLPSMIILTLAVALGFVTFGTRKRKSI